MKKNKMMRLASAMMVMTLMTTSVISGTFAKYVTEGSAADVARVAKWGVTVSASTDAFDKEYATTSTADDEAVLAVKAGEKVVAPGTNSGEVGDDFVFTISGTPEVATKVTIEIEDIKDVFLKEGTYTDWTKAPYDDTFSVGAEGYYPVQWTLKVTDESEGVTDKVLIVGTLAEVETFVNNYVSVAEYAPGEQLDATFTLSWEWLFEVDDQADTLLGNLATKETKFTDGVDADDYSTDVSFSFTVTVTQVD